MTDPDERPRPAYGEYATPEEQRARIRQPDPMFAPMPQPAHPAPTPPPPVGQPAPIARGRLLDRMITVALLGSGLFTVLNAAVGLSNFSTVAETWMKTMGISGSFTMTDQAQIWATVGTVLLVGGWIVTALLSWRALARGRYAWWIPVVGAFVSLTAFTICIMVALFTDPAIAHWFETYGEG